MSMVAVEVPSPIASRLGGRHAPHESDGIAETIPAIVGVDGDPVAPTLRALTAGWEDVQRTRLGLDQRGIPSEGMRVIEERLGREIRRSLEAHPVWPWLSGFRGLGGVHTARIVAMIDDPHRFPGRVCDAGHHHSAAARDHEIERPPGCGVKLADGSTCTAQVGPVRPGTGTRALWHYLGLHVVDGRSPRKRAGHKADWNPRGRTAVLQPGGIAEQIVRARVPVYRDIYDQAKERLTRERLVEQVVATEQEPGQPLPGGPEAGARAGIDATSGLRPYQIDVLARKIAAKAFVADLLAAWKRAVPL